MNRSILTAVVAVLISQLLYGSGMAQEPQSHQYTPQDGILLLRNGQVLRGKISSAGDRYVVALAAGEVRVKAADVELQCRDMAEGYERKRGLVTAGSAQEHLDLAQWCIQHDLPGYAAREISEALAIEPANPRIALLERRLALTRQKPAILKAVFESPEAAIPADELDRLTRSLPAGAMETFTNSIQPLLLNNCTAAGCHGPGADSPHRWVRVSLGRTSSRRLTQRNLHTTLQLINRDNPAESPLLTVPTRAHGSAKSPIFTEQEVAQLRQLAYWVQQVARPQTPQQPSTVASQSSTLSQNLPASGVRRAVFEEPVPPVATKGWFDSAVDLRTLPASETYSAGNPPPRSEPKRGEPPAAFKPKDAFDPEIFNRRYFGD